MAFFTNLLKRSAPNLVRISLAHSVTMKPSQAVRSLSFFALMTLNRFCNVGGLNCTIMTTRQRFTHMLGVTEPGQCGCAKRVLSTIPPKEPKDPTTVDIEDLKSMLAANDIQLFDVREPYELQELGRIPNSVNVPLREVPEAFTMKPKDFMSKYNAEKPKRKDENIVFHCKAGIRSKSALNAVYRLGFRK
ncbi:hypothetical protein QZH41_018581 [Actinostola sp. cb2023]|nr:hypothetical protein QZH41_018581 [Actinostola sp. cb2023]